MGSPISQIQAPQTNQPQGKGGQITYPSQSGQPQMGQPNNYSNTVGPWDNASIGYSPVQTFMDYTPQSQPNRQRLFGGKGKGA